MKNNIWILTEERPKESVVAQIMKLYGNDFQTKVKIGKVSIEPIIKNGIFKFIYIIKGISCKGISKFYLKIVSGDSSFVDYLLVKQLKEPKDGDCSNILMAVEETKTSDDESRNTGVYQRCSKFIYAKIYCPNVKLYMLYNDELKYRKDKKPSDTNIFGTNMLLTLGVTIVGKSNLDWYKQYESIDELIEFKNSMRKPPEGNEPITIIKNNDSIEISGRLDKPGNIGKISHDPNIGALSIISKTIRDLGWNKKIIITHHHIEQQNVKNNKSKFLMLCKNLALEMQGLTLTYADSYREKYWHYEISSEKVASILLHMICNNNGIKSIYENHAGCERGYFETKSHELIALPKKDATGINNLLIPDIILNDSKNKIIYLIEGKKLSTLNKGLEEIKDYDSIENEYVKPNYEGYVSYLRFLSIFGGNKTELPNRRIMLYLNEQGLIIINKDLPASLLKIFNKIKRG